jgi:hypothetical protein
MKTRDAAQRLAVGALLAVGIAAGYTGGGAQAAPGPVHAGGPYTWCPGNDRKGGPGQPFLTNPPNWDWNVCHSYYVVQAGKGNVAPGIWEGDNPPLPPPGPPPPWAP